jgi:hypothetical protein
MGWLAGSLAVRVLAFNDVGGTIAVLLIVAAGYFWGKWIIKNRRIPPDVEPSSHDGKTG